MTGCSSTFPVWRTTAVLGPLQPVSNLGLHSGGSVLWRPTFLGGHNRTRRCSPSPIPYKDLFVDKLADAISEALKPSSKQKVHEVSEIIQRESGVENAISNFHRHLPYERMRCALCPSRPAVGCLDESKLALSAFATTVLVKAGLIDPHVISGIGSFVRPFSDVDFSDLGTVL